MKQKTSKKILFFILILSILQISFLYSPLKVEKIARFFSCHKEKKGEPFQEISYQNYCAMCDTERSFKFTISSDGLLVYEGLKDVKIVGKMSRQLSGREMSKLTDAYNASDFFSQSPQELLCMDGNDIALSVSTSSQKRTFASYCFNRFPEEIVDFERAVYNISDVNDWVGKP